MKSLLLLITLSFTFSAFAQQKTYINIKKVSQFMGALTHAEDTLIVRQTLKSETGATTQTYVEENKMHRAIRKACMKVPHEMDICFLLAAGADADNMTLIDLANVERCLDLRHLFNQDEANECMLKVWNRWK